MGLGVHAHLVVRRIDSHGLLTHSRLITVTGRLVVIWERNDGGADTENHGRMDLAVGEGRVLCARSMQVSQTHGDHSSLFFFHIDKLNQTLLAAGFEVPSTASHLGGARGDGLITLVEHHLDVPLPNLQLIVFYNEERSLDAACVGAELDLSPVEVSND